MSARLVDVLMCRKMNKAFGFCPAFRIIFFSLSSHYTVKVILKSYSVIFSYVSQALFCGLVPQTWYINMESDSVVLTHRG